jgi:hypothetical protein
VLKALKEQLEHKAYKVPLVLKVLLEHRVLQDFKVYKVPLVLKVSKALLVLQAEQDQLVFLVLPVFLVHKVFKV